MWVSLMDSYQSPQLKKTSRGFSGSPAVKNLPANAGGIGLIPSATELLSLCATTTEPVL